ncbi:hypothetical protein BU24DRAFT_407951 [Aaosphaeria arxii CBS 175.79]|uniref:Uncharacterized protein n=1 Tax=Aaosphaeria arxii CBS 175.79 TaxID=1450172 RepID=A0A6A5XZD3_9PLEO|nr:uncharacterized protein BU24DRAFT_407951 [Aaosphaeria arxii CBS 175.79]KAF2017990.1 hypothetical protein BU24DRAFT_407951 [Aaosphaeria arxii CBS 175.79]
MDTNPDIKDEDQSQDTVMLDGTSSDHYSEPFSEPNPIKEELDEIFPESLLSRLNPTTEESSGSESQTQVKIESPLGQTESGSAGFDESALDQPAFDHHNLDSFLLYQPATGQSAINPSALGQSVLGQSTLEQSVLNTPVFDQSAHGQPALDHPVLDQSALNESAATTDEPTTNESTLDQYEFNQPAPEPWINWNKPILDPGIPILCNPTDNPSDFALPDKYMYCPLCRNDFDGWLFPLENVYACGFCEVSDVTSVNNGQAFSSASELRQHVLYNHESPEPTGTWTFNRVLNNYLLHSPHFRFQYQGYVRKIGKGLPGGLRVTRFNWPQTFNTLGALLALQNLAERLDRLYERPLRGIEQDMALRDDVMLRLYALATSQNTNNNTTLSPCVLLDVDQEPRDPENHPYRNFEYGPLLIQYHVNDPFFRLAGPEDSDGTTPCVLWPGSIVIGRMTIDFGLGDILGGKAAWKLQERSLLKEALGSGINF